MTITIKELPGLVERLRAIVSTLHSGGTLYEEDAQDISRAVKVIEAKFYGPAEEISELVERLNDEAMRLQGRGIDRGCVDSSLAGGLATEAADTLESLAAELARLREALMDAAGHFDSLSAWRGGSHTFDGNMGHQPRDFDSEDWDMIESSARGAAAIARKALSGGSPE